MIGQVVFQLFLNLVIIGLHEVESSHEVSVVVEEAEELGLSLHDFLWRNRSVCYLFRNNFRMKWEYVFVFGSHIDRCDSNLMYRFNAKALSILVGSDQVLVEDGGC